MELQNSALWQVNSLFSVAYLPSSGPLPVLSQDWATFDRVAVGPNDLGLLAEIPDQLGSELTWLWWLTAAAVILLFLVLAIFPYLRKKQLSPIHIDPEKPMRGEFKKRNLALPADPAASAETGLNEHEKTVRSPESNAETEKRSAGGLSQHWFSSADLSTESSESSSLSSVPVVEHDEIDAFKLDDEDLNTLFSSNRSTSIPPELIQRSADDRDLSVFSDEPESRHGVLQSLFNANPLSKSLAASFSNDFGSESPISPDIEYDDRIKQLELENQRLSRLCESANRELKSVSDQQVLEIEKCRLEEENQHRVMTEFQLKFAHLQQENELALAQLDVAHQQLVELNASLQCFEEQRSAASEENELLRSQISSLFQDQSRLAELALIEERLEAQCTWLNHEVDELRFQLATESSWRDGWETERQQASKLQQQYSEQIDGFKAEIGQLKTELVKRNRELVGRDDQIQNLIDQLNEKADQQKLAENSVTANTHLPERTADENEPDASLEPLSHKTKEKFTRLFRSYEHERRLRKEAQLFLTQAEEQIVELQKAVRSLKNETGR